MQITLIQNILSFSNISLFLSILLTILFFSLSTMIVPLSLFLFCIYLFPLCQSVPMFAFVSFYLPPLNSISSSVRSSLGLSVFISLSLALSLSLSLSLSLCISSTHFMYIESSFLSSLSGNVRQLHQLYWAEEEEKCKACRQLSINN